MATTTTPAVPAQVGDGDGRGAGDGTDGGGSSLLESVLDNLGAWTVVAAAIGLLYLVWATLEILSRYVGPIPRLAP